VREAYEYGNGYGVNLRCTRKKEVLHERI